MIHGPTGTGPITADHPRSEAASADWIELLALIAACSRKLRASLSERLREQPLNETGFWTLWICHTAPEGEGIVQNELARQLGASAGHVSQVVEQLRVQGWLHSHRSPQDRRRQCWHITPAGRDALANTLRQLETWLHPAGRSFPSTCRQTLRHLLAGLLQSLVAQTAGATSAPTPRATSLAAASSAMPAGCDPTAEACEEHRP